MNHYGTASMSSITDVLQRFLLAHFQDFFKLVGLLVGGGRGRFLGDGAGLSADGSLSPKVPVLLQASCGWGFKLSYSTVDQAVELTCFEG